MKAYELIEKPENWTKEAFARDAGGKAVYCHFDRATCLCVLGAIENAYHDNRDLFWKMRDKLADAVGEGIASWNDAHERTHAEVYNLLKSLDI